MKIRVVAVTAVLTSIMLTACATSGPKFSEMNATMAAVQPEMGRIYFYRTALLAPPCSPRFA
jgi:hypothetical protein